MDIGKQIQQARKKAGMTQAELGEQLGVSGAMIGQWENNQRNPKPETLVRLADALNMVLWELLPNYMSDNMKYWWENGYLAREEEWHDELEFAIEELEIRKNDPLYTNMITAYKKLNTDGKTEAAKRVEELTQIPKYQRTSPEKPLAEADPTTRHPHSKKAARRANKPR